MSMCGNAVVVDPLGAQRRAGKHVSEDHDFYGDEAGRVKGFACDDLVKRDPCTNEVK